MVWWGGTHAAVCLQVLADAAQVDLEAVDVAVLAVVVRQDVVQVEVQDVGMQAADLHVVLQQAAKSEVSVCVLAPAFLTSDRRAAVCG